MSERDIRDIPLSQLELSPDNVRKTPADTSAFTELKASIAAHGLLENLIARAMEPGADVAGTVSGQPGAGPVAGGVRRGYRGPLTRAPGCGHAGESPPEINSSPTLRVALALAL